MKRVRNFFRESGIVLKYNWEVLTIFMASFFVSYRLTKMIANEAPIFLSGLICILSGLIIFIFALAVKGFARAVFDRFFLRAIEKFRGHDNVKFFNGESGKVSWIFAVIAVYFFILVAVVYVASYPWNVVILVAGSILFIAIIFALSMPGREEHTIKPTFKPSGRF